MKKMTILSLGVLMASLFACSPQTDNSLKVSDRYPGVKIGFSTQNFLKAMPLGVENLKEIIDFASDEGFAFIQLRDPSAELSEADCNILADYARERQIEVIYEIHKDFFNPDFLPVFDRAVKNTAIFGEPGILRSILSFSEFNSDKNKKGWTTGEMDHISTLADSCARVAAEQGVFFILENIIEPWFTRGEDLGLDQFYFRTNLAGLQFDAANPFLSSNHGTADPGDVAAYLADFSNRWLTTHLKCAAGDQFQPVLMDNPLPYDEVFELMAANHVTYASLELLAVDSRDACIENHRKSIAYLKEKDIILK